MNLIILVILVPKLCLGTHSGKLCFPSAGGVGKAAGCE